MHTSKASRKPDLPRICDFIWEFPEIRGTILGVPIIRTIIFCGLYWGPLILGNYHIPNTEPAHKSL